MCAYLQRLEGFNSLFHLDLRPNRKFETSFNCVFLFLFLIFHFFIESFLHFCTTCAKIFCFLFASFPSSPLSGGRSARGEKQPLSRKPGPDGETEPVRLHRGRQQPRWTQTPPAADTAGATPGGDVQVWNHSGLFQSWWQHLMVNGVVCPLGWRPLKTITGFDVRSLKKNFWTLNPKTRSWHLWLTKRSLWRMRWMSSGKTKI